MKNMKIYKLILLLVFAQFLYSCGVVKQGFTNERKNSSDEFFVQKKSPLVMPPNYNELPFPKTENEQTVSEESKIKEDSKVILAAFGSGFTWGSISIKW